MSTERSLAWGSMGWDRTWEREMQESHSPHGQLVKWAEVYLKGFSGKRTLEVGSGSGADSAEMAKRGAFAFAVDFSENAVRLSQLTSRNNDSDVQVIQGSALSLPFPNSTFDLVFSEGLLEHIAPKNRKEALREQLRVLKPRGFMIVDIPSHYEIGKGCDDVLVELEQKSRLKLLRTYHWDIFYSVNVNPVEFFRETGSFNGLNSRESGTGYVYRDTRSKYFSSTSV